RVRAARPGGHEAHADLVADLRVGLGGHGRGLLVQGRDGLDAPALAERVVEVHGAAAAHEEDVADAEVGQGAHEPVRQLHGRPASGRWNGAAKSTARPSSSTMGMICERPGRRARSVAASSPRRPNTKSRIMTAETGVWKLEPLTNAWRMSPSVT